MNRSVRWRAVAIGLATAVLLLAGATSASGAGWSKQFTITGDPVSAPPAVAASELGGTLVVWLSFRQSGLDIRARRIGTDGKLGPIRQISGTRERPAAGDWQPHGPFVAVNRFGAGVVVWYGAAFELLARPIGRKGKLGPIRTLAPGYDPGPYNSPEAHVTIDAAGTATVAWSQVVTEYVEPKGSRIRSATAHVRGLHADGRLGETIDLPAGDDFGLGPRVANDAPGKTTVVWLVREGSSQSVQMARISGDGKLGPVREVAPSAPFASAALPVLAAGAAGGSLIAWEGSNALGPALMARRIAVDGALGQPHAVARGGVLYGAAAILDPDDRATIAWTDGMTISARQIAGDDSLQAPLTLATGTAIYRDLSDLALSPGGGATAIWSRRSEGKVAPDRYESDTFVESREIARSGALLPVTALVSGSPPSSESPRLASRRGELTAVWNQGQGNDLWISASRLVSHCPSPRPTRAFARVLKQRRPPRAPGVHPTLAFDRAVEVRFVRAVLTYQQPGGTRRSARLLHPRRLGGPTRYPLFLGTTRAVRRDLDRGSRAWVRVVIRTRPYRTGCDFGKRQVVRLAARVR
jgi:hypothetical protein